MEQFNSDSDSDRNEYATRRSRNRRSKGRYMVNDLRESVTNLSDDDNSETDESLSLKIGGKIVSSRNKFGSDGGNETFYPKGFRKDSPSRNTGWGDNDNDIKDKDNEWDRNHRSSSSTNNNSWTSAGVTDKTSNSWVSRSDSQEKENEGPPISGSSSWQSASRGGLGEADNDKEKSSSIINNKTRRPPPKGARPERMKMPSRMKSNDNTVNPDFEIEDDVRSSRDRTSSRDSRDRTSSRDRTNSRDRSSRNRDIDDEDDDRSYNRHRSSSRNSNSSRHGDNYRSSSRNSNRSNSNRDDEEHNNNDGDEVVPLTVNTNSSGQKSVKSIYSNDDNDTAYALDPEMSPSFQVESDLARAEGAPLPRRSGRGYDDEDDEEVDYSMMKRNSSRNTNKNTHNDKSALSIVNVPTSEEEPTHMPDEEAEVDVIGEGTHEKDDDALHDDSSDDGIDAAEMENIDLCSTVEEEKTSGPSYVMVAQPGGINNTPHVQCLIVREKASSFGLFGSTSNKGGSIYKLIREDDKKILVIAKKMNLNRTSNYHMFDMTRGMAGNIMNLTKKSGNYLGKLRATNLGRTEYNLMTKDSSKLSCASITFERNGLMNQFKEGSQPRRLNVVVPRLDVNMVPLPADPKNMTSEASVATTFKFHSKDPVFEKGNYRLNFKGRVSVPSVKNFQLVSPDDIDYIICQFGKIGEDRFHLDYRAPLNAFQAFGLALAQFNL